MRNLNTSDLVDAKNIKCSDVGIRKIFNRAIDLLTGGKLPVGEDKKGHTVSIRFNVTPAFNRIVSGVLGSAPPNLYKSNAEFYRALISVGSYLALQIFRNSIDDPVLQLKIDKLISLLQKYDALSHEEEIDALEKEFNHLRVKYVEKGNYNGLDNVNQLYNETREFFKPIISDDTSDNLKGNIKKPEK